MAKKKTAKNKNKEKKHRGGFIGFLVFAFVLVVIGNVMFSYNDRLQTTIVRSGEEEDMISATGYIFRDQTVINAPCGGFLYCEVAEDERVCMGDPVMYIYKNEINLTANSELKVVEEKISELSEGLRSSEVFSSDTAKLEQNIAQTLRKIPRYGAKGNLERVSEICEEVNSLIEKRRIISGEIEAPDREKELAELNAQKAELEKKYNIERTVVHSPKSGAFTSRIDGLEDKLTPEALENINRAYLKEIDKQYKDSKASEKVEAGQPIGKIVNNFVWSVAVQIEKELAEGLSVGSELEIRFPDTSVDTIKGTVSKITSEESGKVILVVNSNQYTDAIYSTSRTKVELIKHSYEGFRIPAKSLRMIDGQMGVYVVRSNKARFIPIELMYSGESWVVVTEQTESFETPKVLKLYDELIIDGKDIYEGKVVR